MTENETKTKQPQKLNDEEVLRACIGSEVRYKHWLPGVYYSEGVKLMADTFECWWLVDAIASYMNAKFVSQTNNIRNWLLKKEPDGSYKLKCDGRGKVSQPFERINLAHDMVVIWTSRDGLIFLPSEY